MKKRKHPLIIRIMVIMTLVMTVAACSAAVLIIIAITKSIEQTTRAHSFSSVQLVKLYLDISVPGDWLAHDGMLYKGERRLVADADLWESLEGYLEPGTSILFGIGAHPSAAHEDRLMAALGLRSAPDALSENFRSKRMDKPVPTESGAFISVGNAAGEEVGWISIAKGKRFAPRLRGGPMILIVMIIAGLFLAQGAVFSAILLRVTRPIETIAAAHEEVKIKNDELSNQSRTDPLTGLLNRRGLNDRLAEMRGAGDSFVALLDIDHFKAINDQRGHDEGDRALSSIASTLSSHVRSGDLCCRWGGEEFIVILNQATGENAMASAERIRAAIEALSLEPSASKPGLPAFRVTVTIGLAAVGARGFPEALKAADRAMYKGKREGRNRVVSGDEPAQASS